MSQLALDEKWTSGAPPQAPGSPSHLHPTAQACAAGTPGLRDGVEVRSRPQEPVLCAGCRAREARYGFRDETHDDPAADRPATLCFECFRVEIGRRQAVAARLARGWNASQVALPLEQTLESLNRRRRRAQIAARRALELR